MNGPYGATTSPQNTPGLGGGACSWITSHPNTNTGIYNGLWIRAVIDLPDDPDAMCDGDDCWWKMDLDLDVPTDRTTWTARVIGNR